ncbi:hypothetical protein [Agromyces sp. ZXT2-6]|uniref:hypothetical protein n=1 Tax=Agromyces sp. ZXT2-6 TaxID=3461153 RepID=UPI0040552248
MRAATAVSRMPLARAALLGSGLAAAWVVVSLVSGPSSASAEEDPNGLLGTVGTAVGVLDAVADEVVEPVVAVVTPVADAVESVEAVAPAPVQPVVETAPVVVDTVTDAANGTLDLADSGATEVVTELAAAVSDLAEGSPVDSISDPIIGVVDEVAGTLPVVGPVLGDDTLGGLLGPVVGAVDGTLGIVVGDFGPLPDGGILPSLPDLGVVPSGPGTAGPDDPATGPGDALPAGSAVAPGMGATSVDIDASRFADRMSDARPPGTAAPIGAVAPTPGASGDGSGTPLGTSAPAGGSASAGAGAGGVAGSDTAFAAHDLDALASLVLHAVDDALPSSPVFDTDTTPD